MIVFLDTSALLKRYLDEEGSDVIHAAFDSEAEISVSAITYVEMHSALSRLAREKFILETQRDKILNEFEVDWLQFGKVRVDDSLLERAGKLCLTHAIRSLDALQLAAALTASESQDEPFVFLTADERLKTVAHQEKLQTHPTANY